MAIISPMGVNDGNQISGGKHAKCREHVLVSQGKSTTPALRWALLPVRVFQPQARQGGGHWGGGAWAGEEELHFPNGFHLL